MGRRLGALGFRLSRRSRAVALENLRFALGVEGPEAERIAKESFRIAGASLADLLRAPRVTLGLARRHMEIAPDTLAHLREVAARKKGVVFACAHYGNWEFSNLTSPFSGLPPARVIIRPLRNVLLDRVLFWLRSRTGITPIGRSGAGMELLDWVRAGNVVGIVCDVPVPPDAGATVVDFLGKPAYTTVAIGYLAAMSGAPVYLLASEHLRGQTYRLVLRGPLEAPVGETLRETAAETTRRVTKELESLVRANPSHWGWWIKRWRIIPKDAGMPFPSYSLPVDMVHVGRR